MTNTDPVIVSADEPHPGTIPPPTTSTTEKKPNSKARKTTPQTPTNDTGEMNMTTTEPTPAELSRLALADAQVAVTVAQAEHEQRQTAAEDFRSRLTSGKTKGTDLDTLVTEWLHTTAAEEVAAQLVKGAENAVQRAERALINDDTSMADVLADVLRELYAGHLPVHVVTLAADVKPNDNGDPVLYVVQEKSATNNGGILSGSLALTYFRRKMHTVLDVQDIEAACRTHGYGMDFRMGYSTDHGTYFQDKASVSVERAWLPVPVLDREPDDVDFDRFATVVWNTLRNAVTPSHRGPRLYATGEESDGRAYAQPVSRTVVDRSSNGSERRVTLEVVSKVWRDVEGTGAPVALLREAVAGMVGTMTDDIGRIASVEDCQVATPDFREHFSDTKPFVVTAHFTLTYRID